MLSIGVDTGYLSDESVIVEEEVPVLNLNPAVLEVGHVAVVQPQLVAQLDPESIFYQTYVAHLQVDTARPIQGSNPWRLPASPATPAQKAKYWRALWRGLKGSAVHMDVQFYTHGNEWRCLRCTKYALPGWSLGSVHFIGKVNTIRQPCCPAGCRRSPCTTKSIKDC